MVIKTITDELIEEALQTLTGDNQNIARDFHDLAQDLNLKISMRRNLQKAGKGYYLEYSARKPARRLFYQFIHVKYKTMEQTFRVKANLFHIGNYRDLVESCPVTIKNMITSTGACVKCNDACTFNKLAYTIDGVMYDPCYGQGHYFENLAYDDWVLLKTLIFTEYKSYTVT